MEDSFQHKGLRNKMVVDLRKKGISDERVLDAMFAVPRHYFMDSSFVQFAYRDQAFPIRAGQTISQPYTVAYQTQLLEAEPMHKVLEIGTGSGYQSAILAKLGTRVYTIERQKELYLTPREVLTSLGLQVNFFYGDGYQGLPTYGPFDRILITAAAAEIPPMLLEQLKPGGRLVVPIGKPDLQVMTLVEKNGPGVHKITQHGSFVFVPMLNGKQ
jgi:protein-L-isoaspartate(D-aspartate) O-methyltransferase